MPKARPTLYLVDAMSNIHRAYHAISRLSTSAGQPTNAVYGFVTMLKKLLREHEPDAVAAAFDLPGKTVRHEAYEAYKADRKPMEEDLATQIPLVRRACQAYRVPILEMPGYEADDVIGSVAAEAVRRGYDTVIVTADKDMLQLVSPHVRVYHTGRERFLDEAGVQSFFGVAPGQVADVLALMGDSSDNIPGVPRVGEVTAKKWIAEHGTLDALLANADTIKGKVGESLRENRQMAVLSKSLTLIKTDLPVTFDTEALKLTPPDAASLKALLTELEFHSLAAEVEEPGLPPAYEIVRIADSAPFSLPAAGGPLGLALLTHGGRALLASSDGSRVEIAEQAAEQIVERFAGLDRAGRALAVADAKPLDKLLARSGRSVQGDVLDAGLLQYVLAPGVASSDFEILAFQRLKQRVLPDAEVAPDGASLADGYEIAAADRWLAERAGGSVALCRALSAELNARPALTKVYREIERPLTAVLARMELAGVAVDTKLLSEMSARMEKDLRALEQRIWAEAGEEFNVNSPVKLGEILFTKLGYPSLKKTAKTRSSSTGVEVLTELSERGYPLPKLVLEFREIAKLKGTYVDALPALADSEGRVHTTFAQTVAATGRLSSTDPNLQNIPIRTAAGREIRRAFVAPKGQKLVVADYSQIELRILAHISGDKALIDAFERGRDVHAATAAKVFGVAPDLVSLEMRTAAKRINFGLLYGMGAFSLAKDLGVPTSEARTFIESYFAQFPSVRACLDGVLGQAREKREVTTVFGRVRPIPDIAASNPNVRSNAERMALNAPFQGTAADIIKMAMVALDRALSDRRMAARLVLQVHDELVLEAPDAEVENVKALVREVMESAASLKVRLAVDVGAGTDWLSAK
jgi:DNA polymerase-1